MRSSRYFEIIKPGVFGETGYPAYGRQDIGISPCGAMDLFSLARGNLMLRIPVDTPGLEIIIPPELKVKKHVYFILTGAKRNNVFLKRNLQKETLQFNQVCLAEKEDVITMGVTEYGFRTYLCFTEGVNNQSLDRSKIIAFDELSSWKSPTGKIRIIMGPEYNTLENPKAFFEKPWKTTHDMSAMGMRIEGGKTLQCKMENMVSEAVSTGTIQLTPKGPIILLRHRQTIGGYPRIFNVIDADIDLLGQYAPGQFIRFELVDMENAFEINLQKEKELENLKNML